MKPEEDYEIDIKLNKVKEGFLIKRSRILKEWKQRWMVLTKTHLYSFVQKQVYKKPTESIPLRQVSTIKSYYKNQYNRPQVIRIESQDADFYLSAKNHQEKWAWMTAIEKMTDYTLCGAEDNGAMESQNMIRETLRMSTAIRKTVKGDKMVPDVPKDLMKRLKLIIDSNCTNAMILPSFSKSSEQIQQPHISPGQQKTLHTTDNESKKQIVDPKIVEKIVQKVVYVPEYKEKIVYVPEIKEVVKTVHVEKSVDYRPFRADESSLEDERSFGLILGFFEHVMQLKCENPKSLIEFVVFLIFSQPQRYTRLVLQFATLESIQHAFSNAFLQVVNEEIEQSKLNGYLQFIMVLYENFAQYFYQNDLKLLIEILVRQIEMNRSNLNQFLIIGVLNAMASKEWWGEVKHRREELRVVVSDVKAWTNDSQMRFAAEELLQKL